MSVYLLPSLGNLLGFSASKKARLLGRDYEVRPTSDHMRLVFYDRVPLSNPEEQAKFTSIVYVVLEVTWNTLSNHPKGGFSVLVLGFY